MSNDFNYYFNSLKYYCLNLQGYEIILEFKEHSALRKISISCHMYKAKKKKINTKIHFHITQVQQKK